MINNMTPHIINLFREDSTVFDASIRKLLVKDGQVAAQVIEPSGTLLNAKQEERFTEAVYGIPCKTFEFTSVDAYPQDTDHYYVVSALYVSACKALGLRTDRLLTVRGTVYKSATEPKPIGCLGFYRN